ncbi:hypothetical protein MPK70_gp058 [Erwinia phage pEa_SNUABM_33]|uniref:Uncharacterized protein n=1 Tax=Erwinia phage pEa_SNUABM_33 TaxID=2869556 RepID=A0AAE7XMX5_9CAUD|nr:hypothetical protein MPK70_gp058 [Erwinia phage pEa_SNUABM_33]QZE57934.1 hypothetical protein pEaSNUABM33_00058 [Erwinia phage pEa_SNUABM_33]WAK44410.1 hypothetical protein [Erwinia phage vB_Ea_2910A]
MLKRLLALFSKKKPQVKKTFEEKLDAIADATQEERLADQIRRDEERLRRALHPGHQPVRKKERHVVVDAPRKRYQPQRSAARPEPLNRGMTINQTTSNRVVSDDLTMAMLMRETYVAPAPIRSYDDNCRVDHTPSHRHSDPDPSPAYDGGSDSGYSGGSGCD